jgi:hypothetical protein
MTEEEIDDKAKEVYKRCFDDYFNYKGVLNALRIAVEETAEQYEKENEQLRADYDKQKEINIELVDDMAELHIRIRELETQLKRVTEAQGIPF